MTANVEGVEGIPEFRVKFGFTRDCSRIRVDALEFIGVVKVTPKAIGIYRTGDRFGWLLVLWRALGRHVYGRGMDSDSLAPHPADVAANTDGTPEHVIDPKRMTLLVDERKHYIILQTPGRMHFVLRARRHGVTPASAVEAELIDALERCAGARAQAVACRIEYMASIPFLLLVVVAAFFVAMILAMLFQR